jgi:hypothetical protein
LFFLYTRRGAPRRNAELTRAVRRLEGYYKAEGYYAANFAGAS